MKNKLNRREEENWFREKLKNKNFMVSVMTLGELIDDEEMEGPGFTKVMSILRILEREKVIKML